MAGFRDISFPWLLCSAASTNICTGSAKQCFLPEHHVVRAGSVGGGAPPSEPLGSDRPVVLGSFNTCPGLLNDSIPGCFYFAVVDVFFRLAAASASLRVARVAMALLMFKIDIHLALCF